MVQELSTSQAEIKYYTNQKNKFQIRLKNYSWVGSGWNNGEAGELVLQRRAHTVL